MHKPAEIQIAPKMLLWLPIAVLIAFCVYFLQIFGSSFGLAHVLVLAASYFLICYTVTQDKTIDLWTVLFAAFLAACYAAAEIVTDYSLEDVLQSPYILLLFGFSIAGLWLLFYFCIRAAAIFMRKHPDLLMRKRTEEGFRKHFLLCSFLLIFACWMPWAVLNYPGTFCNDAHLQLRQFFGVADFTAHHPPLSTYIMGTLVLIGDFFIDKNFGCFLYLLLQICAGGVVYSVGIQKLYLHGMKLRYCVLFLLFYALTPFWGCFAQWYEKDLLYAEATTLFLIYLIDVVVKRKCERKDALLLAITGTLVCLLRNNGVYAVMPTLFLLAFYLDKRFRKAAGISLLSVLLIYAGFVKVLYPSVLGIEDGSIAEALSIPFQQTARYVCNNGDEVTEYEKSVIDSVLDYDAIAKSYDPVLSDPIKSTYKGDNTKLPEYFKVWFQMFLKHPRTYITALLYEAYGYIAPIKANVEAPLWSDSEAVDEHSYLTKLGIHKVFDTSLSQILQQISDAGMSYPLVKRLCTPGLYSWITWLCGLVSLKKKKGGILIILVPELVNILVCIASPLPNSMRYMLPVVAAAPLMIGWTYFLACPERRTNSRQVPAAPLDAERTAG